MPEPIDLATIARDIQAALRENRANGLDDGNALDVTALLVAEEAGEVDAIALFRAILNGDVGACRRWSGHARRPDTREELGGEIADLLIGAAILAHLAEIDINEAVRAKVAVIFSRGWKEPADA
jgi:NTP pyrophosphatase (non-canonical NTP hydrolase)